MYEHMMGSDWTHTNALSEIDHGIILHSWILAFLDY